MIKDNSLEDHLNSNKNNTQFINEVNSQLEDSFTDESDENYKSLTFIDHMYTILSYFFMYVFVPIVIGYGINTLLNKNWNIFAIYSVGYLSYYILDEIKLMIKK
jgi:hypothetical protein